MDASRPPTESCTLQLLPQGHPSHEWTPEHLSAYARAQKEAIVDGERRLTAVYWRLGVALNLLRRNFQRGQWKQMLEQLGIHKSTASRAQAIARTFAAETEVAELTVQEAYDRRERKAGRRATDAELADRRSPLQRFLANLCETAESLVDEAAFLEHDQALALLPVVRDAMSKLEVIESCLEDQACR